MTQLISTLLQGGNDAFVQTSLNTGLSASGTSGWKITQIQIEYITPLNIPVNSQIELALSRASQVAMPLLSEDDVLYKDILNFRIAASGGFIFDKIQEYRPTEEIVLIEETVFLQLDSVATANANTAIVRVTVEEVKVSTAERIAILQSRIN